MHLCADIFVSTSTYPAWVKCISLMFLSGCKLMS